MATTTTTIFVTKSKYFGFSGDETSVYERVVSLDTNKLVATHTSRL